MKPYVDNVVTVAMMVRGFEGAVDRLEAASGGNDESAMFCPLFEALNWAVALDDRLGVTWVPDGESLGFDWRTRVHDAQLMAGVRFARNRVHHNWADALELRDGLAFPLRFPMAFVTWAWRDIGDLPRDRPDKLGEQIYEDQLQGHPVLNSLVQLRDVFQFVLALLEPAFPNGAVRPSP